MHFQLGSFASDWQVIASFFKAAKLERTCVLALGRSQPFGAGEVYPDGGKFFASPREDPVSFVAGA